MGRNSEKQKYQTEDNSLIHATIMSEVCDHHSRDQTEAALQGRWKRLEKNVVAVLQLHRKRFRRRLEP